MLKEITNYLFVLSIFFFTEVNAKNENRIIVKVNNKIVSSYEIKNKINTELILRNLEINQENINKFKNFALQELIKLRIKEIEILKYRSSDVENINISRQLNNVSSGNIENLKKKFKENNLDYNIYIREIKIQTAWQQLIFQLYKDKVEIDENEIVKLANKYKNKSKIREFNLSELVVSFQNKNEIKKKINEVKKSINEIGFEKSINILSEAETASDNGRLGFINENAFSKDIFENITLLKEGKISEPIIQNDKILFLKVNKIKILQNNDLDFEKIKKNIENRRKNDLFNLYSESHLSKVKNNSYIEFK
tara:strand:- start:13128 stop:14054 length:927 start_codon:yes stop_codon:yes gene_type:complete